MANNNDVTTGGTSGRSNRGFAAMDPREQREIARKGGEAVSQDREHMAAIGRKGGEASGGGNRGQNRPGTGTESQGMSAGSRESEGRFESPSRSQGASQDLSGGMNPGGRESRH
jgi:hypothetical protein